MVYCKIYDTLKLKLHAKSKPRNKDIRWLNDVVKFLHCSGGGNIACLKQIVSDSY